MILHLKMKCRLTYQLYDGSIRQLYQILWASLCRAPGNYARVLKNSAKKILYRTEFIQDA